MQRIQATSRWRRLKAVQPLRRILAYAFMSMALALSVLTPLNIQKASAWGLGVNLPTCTVSGGAFSWAWKDRAQQLLGLNPDAYAGSIIIGKRGNDADLNTPIAVWFSTSVSLNQINTGSSQGRQFEFVGGDGAVLINNNPNVPALWQQINSIVAPFSTNVTLNDFTCIMNYSKSDGNPVYATTYTGNYYNANAVPNQTTAQCSPLDIACRIADVFQGVQNTFASVGQFIVKGIANIFIPSSTTVQSSFNELNTFLVNKLGFLMYPFTFMTNLITAFNSTSNNWCSETSCTKSFGNLWGAPFAINFLTLKQSLPDYWNWFIALLRGVAVITLIQGIYHATMRVLRGTE